MLRTPSKKLSRAEITRSSGRKFLTNSIRKCYNQGIKLMDLALSF